MPPSQGAPSYGGMRTWVEGSQAGGNRTLAEASNLLGFKEYAQQDFIQSGLPTLNT